jgi:hypothetical protein
MKLGQAICLHAETSRSALFYIVEFDLATSICLISCGDSSLTETNRQNTENFHHIRPANYFRGNVPFGGLGF